MTDKQTDTKTYNCVYCNKTLTKFETQPLYKDGEFLTTCEECWNKHAKEEGYVVSDVQTINITIDDLINGNLRDMEITAQFGVYRQAVKGLAEQLKAKEQECDVLRKLAETHLAETINMQREIDLLKEDLAISIQENEEGREINAELKAENEELRQLLSKEPLALQSLQSGYADYKKRSEVFFEMINHYKQALTEIKEIAEHCIKQDICTTCDNSDKCHIEDEEIPTYDVCKLILQKISEVLDE